MKKPKGTTAKGINWGKVDEKTYAKIRADEAGKVIIRENNAELIKQEIHDGILHALEEVGLLAERFAKENLTKNRSVDTGRLRNSITHAIDAGDMSVVIGTNVEYAQYVELGTRKPKRDPKPYLKPAAEEHEQQFAQVFKKHMP